MGARVVLMTTLVQIPGSIFAERSIIVHNDILMGEFSIEWYFRLLFVFYSGTFRLTFSINV